VLNLSPSVSKLPPSAIFGWLAVVGCVASLLFPLWSYHVTTVASCRLTEYLTNEILNVVPDVPPICIWSVTLAFVVGKVPVTNSHSLRGKSVNAILLLNVPYSLKNILSLELPSVLFTYA